MRLKIATVLSGVMLFAGALYGGIVAEVAKLLPNDGALGDEFGTTVSISGSIGVVGARLDDFNGLLSGSAYVFDTTSGLQMIKLLPDDGAADDRFGTSVGVSGGTIIVGAPLDDDNGVQSGAAYLFDAVTGAQIAKLLPDDGAAGDEFGASVAISGGIAVVGAYLDDDNGLSSGAAYVFSTSTGMQLAKLLPADGAEDDQFGFPVAVSGSTAVVGARLDDDSGADSGSAYLFDTTTGTEIAKLVPVDGAADDEFGGAVAICGNTAIVGRRLDDDNGTDSGSAYLFDATTGNEIFKLHALDSTEFDEFGWSVAISGTTAVVGAVVEDAGGFVNSGSAYQFDTSTGMQTAKLVASDGAANDFFGFSVAVSEGTAVVGARFDDDNGSSSGSAYLFDVGAVCEADLSGDGVINFDDLNAVLGEFGLSGNDLAGDANGDGLVNFKDLNIVLGVYGTSCP